MLETLLSTMLFLLLLVTAGCTHTLKMQNAKWVASRQQVAVIEAAFRDGGLAGAHAGIDAYGRVMLQGEYQDKKTVDQAFAIAQTVVGVNRVSPVEPENIRVKEWEKKVEDIFRLAKTRNNQTASPVSAPSDVIGRKYALVVGLSQFRNPRITLKYAKNDARSFYDYLTGAQGGFSAKNVSLLTNESATKASIEEALTGLERRAEPNDLIVLYFSSHGTPPYTNGVVHVVTYDTDLKDRMTAWDTSLSGERIRSFLSQVQARRVIVVLDTCYSSGAYKNVAGFFPAGEKSLDLFEENYGTPQELLAKAVMGSKDITLEDEPASRSEGPKDAWGTVLLSASGAGEKSWESDTLQNSFFTYYLLDGLRKSGNVKEGFFYAKPQVIAGVKREKDAEQNPQVVTSRPEWGIELGR